MNLISKLFYYLIIIQPVFYGAVLNADTITTNNGATLIGTITMITPEKVIMQTEYAGSITINANQITKLSTDSAVSSRLEDGSVITGITEISEDGFISVENEMMSMRASMDNLLASWVPENNPPDEAGYPMDREWQYSIGADITGKKGNSDEMGTSIRGQASLVSDVDELKFYTSIDRSEQNGEDTSDEIIFGTSYVSYFSEKTGWFINSELERDPFESIDLRASVSAGMSYWLSNQPDFSLEFQSGFGYRHETFDDDTTQDSPTLDIRIHNNWKINSWINMTNSISFSPSITDFSDYLLLQDSGINMPIGTSNWSLRLGLKNNYQNEPAITRKKLDTTYYSRLLLNFN